MKVECPRFIGRYFAPVIFAALLGLAQFAAVSAQDEGFTVAPYGYIGKTVANRILMGQLVDEKCGDPTVQGQIALFEVPANKEFGTTVGEIVYLKETDPTSNKQIFKLCNIDVVALHDYNKRNKDQIADVDWNTYRQINPNRKLQIYFEDPRIKENNINTTSITKISPESTEESIYNNTQNYDFHADLSEENTIIPPEQSPVTVVTSGSVYGSQMNIEEKAEPVVPLFEEADSPNATKKCEPGDANEQGEFKVICIQEFPLGQFKIKPASN